MSKTRALAIYRFIKREPNGAIAVRRLHTIMLNIIICSSTLHTVVVYAGYVWCRQCWWWVGAVLYRLYLYRFFKMYTFSWTVLIDLKKIKIEISYPKCVQHILYSLKAWSSYWVIWYKTVKILVRGPHHVPTSVQNRDIYIMYITIYV